MDLASGITKKVIFPLSRAYSQYIMKDKPADVFMEFISKIDFWMVHKYWPNFRAPRSFSEKIFNCMLFDRNPLWTTISDKLRVRNYIASKIGEEYMIPLLWYGDNPEEIPFNILPKQYVIKTNHGCGYNIIIKDSAKINKRLIIEKLKKWLEENFATNKYLGIAWAYKNIKPTIIIETFIGEDGIVPEDYKFFCYAGHTEFVLISFDRFGNHSEKHFKRNFEPLDLWNGAPQYTGMIERPNNYEKMLELADKLAQDFNFIRTDLYSVGNKIYFGELTRYPSGGLARFVPQKYDFIFGQKWVWQKPGPI